MTKNKDMKVYVKESVLDNNIGDNDIDALAKEIGEENMSKEEKLMLAIIMAKETNRPLTYDIIGRIIGASAPGVLKMEKRALKKLRDAAKKAGLTPDELFN